MIAFDIPGFKKITIHHLVLDFNGTLAKDGKLIDGVRPLLDDLSKQLKLHVLTADTFGSSTRELEGIDCRLEILKPDAQDQQKGRYVTDLISEHVIAIGNGRNDKTMLREAVVGIGVIQQEGMFALLPGSCEILCFSITDALDLLRNPKRLIATLRK